MSIFLNKISPDKVKVAQFMKEIHKDRKNENILKNKEEKKEADLRRLKNESNKKNRAIEVKRRAMFRSKPKTIVKKKSNSNKKTQDELDRQYYIGIY